MKNICITIAMFVLCSACNDWLDVSPAGQLAREELFNDYAGFRDALTGCYMSMCTDDAYGRKLTMHVPDIMAQLWTVNQGGELDSYRSIADFDYNSETSQSVFKAIWGGLYRVIVQANAIIEKVDAKADVFPSERERAIVEAEARAIRACCHLDVLRLFGQMPQGGGKTVALPYTEDVSRDPKTYYA
ncbi:MAG: RagB/SusD family nutrient uptake outer membrane protein, partial [Odoribacter sp.]|nr:RagB/SusD family nutrient uptake outer membrane protein [Odoribacter sp.]